MIQRQRDEWQMRDDARTLAAANEIMADKQRHSDAVKMAKTMAADDAKRAEAMKKVAGMSTTKNAVQSNTQRVNTMFLESIARATR